MIKLSKTLSVTSAKDIFKRLHQLTVDYPDYKFLIEPDPILASRVYITLFDVDEEGRYMELSWEAHEIK